MPPSTNGESPSLDLPPPVIESASNSDLVAEKQPANIETNNQPNVPTISSVPTQPISIPDPISPSLNSPAVASSTTNIVAPATADDNDLIEKEWVIKAKKIITNNREDPYNQTKEMTLFRADYMRKRYNKIIKIGE